MADGKVCTGFSYPFVAKYNNNGGVVTYTDGMPLARGVKVSINPETSDDNIFYANNVAAESDAGNFTGGEATLTVDGLLEAAETFINGLPEATAVPYGEEQSTVNIRKYGKKAKPPYVGIGFVIRYQSGGVVTYAPMILTKAKFKPSGTEAETQEDKISYQTQDLEATLHRDDTEEENWKWIAEDQTSEAAAVAILKALLNVTQTAVEGA